jgi:hypothetical protein
MVIVVSQRLSVARVFVRDVGELSEIDRLICSLPISRARILVLMVSIIISSSAVDLAPGFWCQRAIVSGLRPA